MTDTEPITRITLDIYPGKLSEVRRDDRTPTGLSRYGESDLATDILHCAGSAAAIPESFRFERVEETTSAEPFTAQSEPKNLVLHLLPEEIEETIAQTLLSKGIAASVSAEMTSALVDALLKTAHNWLTDAEAAPVAVAEELDLDAFRSKLIAHLDRGGLSHRAESIAAVVVKLLTDGNAPTKQLQGQGLNREQLTTVVDSQLRLDGWSPTQAAASSDRLVAAIEAAQLDGSLT